MGEMCAKMREKVYLIANQIHVEVDMIPNLYQSFHKAKVLCFLDLLFFCIRVIFMPAINPPLKILKRKKKIFFSLVYRKLALGNLLCLEEIVQCLHEAYH